MNKSILEAQNSDLALHLVAALLIAFVSTVIYLIIDFKNYKNGNN